eukprot:15357632-Ditylum_brightwellii.AAC.1
MPKQQICITPEIQVEDNYCISLDENTLCIWNKCSGKEIPKKQYNREAYKDFYNRHIKGIKEAFEEAFFDARYKESVGL